MNKELYSSTEMISMTADLCIIRGSGPRLGALTCKDESVKQVAVIGVVQRTTILRH